MRKWILGFALTAMLAGPAAAADHSLFLQGPFDTGPEVTAKCLTCHAKQGNEMLQSVHWLWKGPAPHVKTLHKKVELGKKNLMNNY